MSNYNTEMVARLRQKLAIDNARLGKNFVRLPDSQLPMQHSKNPKSIATAVWRNERFLVQRFEVNPEVVRLTINRTWVKPDGEWEDGITWDELQDIKSALGFGDLLAIEIFPPQSAVVNDANMRHLWIFLNVPKCLDFVWTKANAIRK